jgi:hypothetical protein
MQKNENYLEWQVKQLRFWDLAGNTVPKEILQTVNL